MSNTELKVHYVKVAAPALSLVFEISDLKKAHDFYDRLQKHGTISPSENETPALPADDELTPLLTLLNAYGVTIAREHDISHRQEFSENIVRAFMDQEGLTREDAIHRVANSAAGEFIQEGLKRFWVTTPRQDDLMRLHHDLGNLGRRLGEDCNEVWLHPLSFRENNVLHLKTLDESVEYAMDDRFKIRTMHNSYMTGMGPGGNVRTSLRVADTPDAFCQPVKP